MTNEITNFTEDSKLFRVGKTIKDFEELQRNLCTLAECVSKCQMSFSVSKGKMIHVCTKNPNSSYKLMGLELAVINEERGFANIIMLLYQARMHLKYCVQFWSAHLKKKMI